jgi:Uma2 family endonuclease
MATVTDLEIEVKSPIHEPAEQYEVVDGRIVEEPPLGAHETRMAARLVRGIVLFDAPGLLGEVVEETLFVIGRSPRLRRRPDIAFVSSERWPADRTVPRENAWDVIPDIAVEITVRPIRSTTWRIRSRSISPPVSVSCGSSTPSIARSMFTIRL